MPAIFLDRDGVINENRADHVKSWGEFCFIPGALPALRWLRLARFHTFVVTNQAIVNRGIVAHATIQDIHKRMRNHIELSGGAVRDIRYCPHRPDEACHCRKPQPGMLLAMAKKWKIDLTQSYFIGDAWTDVVAGRAANTRCILVRTGRGDENLALPQDQQHPVDHVAASLLDAVGWIFAQEGITLSQREPRSRFWPAGERMYRALPVGG